MFLSTAVSYLPKPHYATSDSGREKGSSHWVLISPVLKQWSEVLGSSFRFHTFASWAAVTQQSRSRPKARSFICCSAKVDYGSLRPAARPYWTAEPPTVITALVQKANAEEHSSGAQRLHWLSSQGTGGRRDNEKQTAKGSEIRTRNMLGVKMYEWCDVNGCLCRYRRHRHHQRTSAGVCERNPPL